MLAPGLVGLPSPQSLGLPEKFHLLRPEQHEAATKAIASDKKFIIIEMPPGLGKTALVGYLQRAMKVQMLYCASTKQLQDQVKEDFPYCEVLKGRRNYPTAIYRTLTRGEAKKGPYPRTATCEDCVLEFEVVRHCGLCCDGVDEEGCTGGEADDPYRIQKAKTRNAELAVVNDSYFLTEANGPGVFGATREATGWWPGWQWIAHDEADTLAARLMSHVEVSINDDKLELKEIKMGDPPEWLMKSLDIADWLAWMQDDVRAFVVKAYDEAQEELVTIALAGEADGETRKNQAESVKAKMKDLMHLIDSLEAKIDLSSQWVRVDIDKSGKAIGEAVINEAQLSLEPGEEQAQPAARKHNWKWQAMFRPVTVAPFAEYYLWRHGERWLLMSGTILDPYVFAEDMGIPYKEVEWIKFPSPFPAEKRPIFFSRSKSIRNSHAEEMMAKKMGLASPGERLVGVVDELLDRYTGKRVLIHTVSNARSKLILDTSRHVQRMFTHAKPADRMLALQGYLARPDGVLVSSSFERGVDLKYKDCSAILVFKVPYGNIGDLQILARKNESDGDDWYAIETIRRVIQMSCRGMRAADDFCDVHILDKQFEKLYTGDQAKYFPKWWQDALHFEA